MGFVSLLDPSIYIMAKNDFRGALLTNFHLSRVIPEHASAGRPSRLPARLGQ